MQLWLLKPRKERMWNGQDQSQHKMANDDSFLLQHRAKLWNQKTAYKFYIEAITVKKIVLKQETQSSAVLCCQNTDMSSYRIVQNVSFSNTQPLPVFISKATNTFQTWARRKQKLLERVHAIKETTKYVIATFSFSNSDVA